MSAERTSPVSESLREELSHAICRPNDTKGVVTLSKQLDAVVAIFERFALAQCQQQPFAWRWNTRADPRWRVTIERPVPNDRTAFDKIEPLYTAVSDTSTDRSPVMQAADKAAKVVEGWSDAKREYAGRVTDSSPDREGK
jgi:hypothetical protein